jgi:hypothetical protein
MMIMMAMRRLQPRDYCALFTNCQTSASADAEFNDIIMRVKQTYITESMRAAARRARVRARALRACVRVRQVRGARARARVRKARQGSGATLSNQQAAVKTASHKP